MATQNSSTAPQPRYWYVLAAYWAVLLIGSHLPKAAPPMPGASTDKVVHLTAYAVLSFLLCYCLQRAGYWGGIATAMGAWLVVVGYGVFDEITQPYFNRTCDVYDLYADAVGAVIGIGLFSIWHTLRRSSQTETLEPQ